MSSSNSNEMAACMELERIIRSHYVNNPQFRSELYKALCAKTGNNNLGIICEHIIDDRLTHEKPVVT